MRSSTPSASFQGRHQSPQARPQGEEGHLPSSQRHPVVADLLEDTDSCVHLQDLCDVARARGRGREQGQGY